MDLEGNIAAKRAGPSAVNDVFFDLRLYKQLSKQSWGW